MSRHVQSILLAVLVVDVRRKTQNSYMLFYCGNREIGGGICLLKSSRIKWTLALRNSAISQHMIVRLIVAKIFRKCADEKFIPEPDGARQVPDFDPDKQTEVGRTNNNFHTATMPWHTTQWWSAPIAICKYNAHANPPPIGLTFISYHMHWDAFVDASHVYRNTFQVCSTVCRVPCELDWIAWRFSKFAEWSIGCLKVGKCIRFYLVICPLVLTYVLRIQFVCFGLVMSYKTMSTPIISDSSETAVEKIAIKPMQMRIRYEHSRFSNITLS